MTTVKKINPITQAAADAAAAIGAGKVLATSFSLAQTNLRAIITGAARSPFPYLRVLGLAGIGVLTLADLWRTYSSSRLAIGNGPVTGKTASIAAAAKTTRPPIAAYGKNISQSMVLGFALTSIMGNMSINPTHFRIGADIGENYDPLSGMVMLLALFDPGLVDLAHSINLISGTDAASQILLAKKNKDVGMAREATLATKVMKESAEGIGVLAKSIHPLLKKINAIEKLVDSQAKRWAALASTTRIPLIQAVKGIKNLKVMLNRVLSDQASILAALNSMGEEAKKGQAEITAHRSREQREVERMAAITADTIRGIVTIFALKD